MAIYIFIFFLIILFDQITKYILTASFFLGEEKSIIPGILSFNYIQNKGAAFGMLEGARVFFIILTVLIFIGAIYYIVKMRPVSRLEKTALCFIGGGAIGNFIDRLFLGYVRDFIRVDFIDFPIFNIADCFVTIGAALYILYAFTDTKKKRAASPISRSD